MQVAFRFTSARRLGQSQAAPESECRTATMPSMRLIQFPGASRKSEKIANFIGS
jgi:hypothetical protein